MYLGERRRDFTGESERGAGGTDRASELREMLHIQPNPLLRAGATPRIVNIYSSAGELSERGDNGSVGEGREEAQQRARAQDRTSRTISGNNKHVIKVSIRLPLPDSGSAALK